MSWWERLARTLPLPVKRVLKLLARPVDRLWRWRWRRGHPQSPPVPPLGLRSRVGTGSNVGYYISSGAAVAQVLESRVADAETSLEASGQVLDLACGCGRVISHFLPRHRDTRFFGSDVDAAAIAWAREHLPSAKFTTNRFDPPLPFADGSFDLVYSVSMFTHLTPDNQQRWIGEVRRILKPGGVAMLTTCGEPMLQQFNRIRAANNSAEFTNRVRELRSIEAEREPVFIPYRRTRSNDPDFPGIGDSYGLTFQTPRHTRERWGGELEVVNILPGAINEKQDLVLMRRPD